MKQFLSITAIASFLILSMWTLKHFGLILPSNGPVESYEERDARLIATAHEYLRSRNFELPDEVIPHVKNDDRIGLVVTFSDGSPRQIGERRANLAFVVFDSNGRNATGGSVPVKELK